jgi:large subunit ribosomal protein L21
MYAIVEASGRQYHIEAGRFVDLDLHAVEPGDDFVFDRVLMIVDGKDSHVGSPLVHGAKVKGRVLSHIKDKKIIVYHQKPKKGTRKKQGHRQGYTRILISSIELNDKVLAEGKAYAAKEPKAAKEEKSTKKAAAPKAEKKVAAAKEAAAPKKAAKTTKAKAETSEKPAGKAKKAE